MKNSENTFKTKLGSRELIGFATDAGIARQPYAMIGAVGEIKPCAGEGKDRVSDSLRDEMSYRSGQDDA